MRENSSFAPCLAHARVLLGNLPIFLGLRLILNKLKIVEWYMGIFVELNNFDVSERLIFLKNSIHYGAPNYKEMVVELKNQYEMSGE